MLEFGDAYLENCEAAELELRQQLGDAAYEVALSMAPEFTSSDITAVYNEAA